MASTTLGSALMLAQAGRAAPPWFETMTPSAHATEPHRVVCALIP